MNQGVPLLIMVHLNLLDTLQERANLIKAHSTDALFMTG